MAEDQIREQAVMMAELEASLRLVLSGLTITAEVAKQASTTAAQTASACQELRTPADRLLKSQDSVVWVVNNIDARVEGIGARLTALESLSPSATPKHHGPDGHREEAEHQDTAPERVLGNGVYNLTLPVPAIGPSTEQDSRQFGFRQDKQYRENNNFQFRMPKTNFPKFDGTHPKIWKEKAEKYFHMFHVPVECMVDYATLHFTGQAALWLQTYEAQHTVDNWAQLCVAVCQKFGKDLYYSQMSQTLDIKQLTDVDSHQQEFEQLMHQLLTHNPALDETFFVAKFVKGLKKEIRSAIVLHASLGLSML